MEQLQQQHHIEDVGRILLQTQDQLRQLREQLAAQNTANGNGNGTHSGGSNNNAGAEIDEILQRAEDELRMKAELVLHNIVTAAPTSPKLRQRKGDSISLPSVRKPFNPLSSSLSPRGSRRRKPALGEYADADASDDYDLDYFRRRFKNSTVEKHSGRLHASSELTPPRRGGGMTPSHRNGKVAKHKTATNARLLPFVNKLDPTAPRPLLSAVDAKQGVLNLLNRGFLPHNVDLTPAFQSTTSHGNGNNNNNTTSSNGGVITNGPAKIYRRQEQPVRATPYSNPSNFNLATLRFDMDAANVPISQLREHPGDGNALRSPEQRTAKTVTINFPDGENDGEKSRNQRDNTNSRYEDEDDDGGIRHGGSGGNGGGEATTEGDDKEESDVNSMEDLRKNVDKIRGYNELLDTYSLHQFIIHKGRAMSETPEFQSFKRVGHEIWGSIEEVIRALENLLMRYFVPLAYIDGQRLMGVASMEMASFTTQELLSCIVNEDQVASLIRRPGQRYKGKDRKRRAATTIQAFFRMLLHRNRFRKVRRNGSSAMLIQKMWRAYFCQQALRAKLTQRRKALESQWQSKMTRLRTQWRDIKQMRRVVVHVPSISIDERARLSIENFSVKQNLQLSRLAGVLDANVEIVYVSPFELSSEISQYFIKLLQLGGIANASSRVKLVFPEHAAQFPAHFSLTTHLLYSPHCLRRIQRLTKDKEAYLVMGMPGVEDQRLALTLQIPMLGLPDPRAAVPLMTRSGSKRFFIKADVNVPTGTYDIYSVDELLFSLSKLIISHLDQNAWLLRLDNDPFGVGTAVLDVATLTTLREIRREKKPPEYWRQPGIRDTIAHALLQELEKEIATLTKPCHPEVFASWREFENAIATYGVVIEAMPAHTIGVVRANLFVEPSGEVHVMSTQDALTNGSTAMQKRRRPVAFAFPQSIVPHEALTGASKAIGRLLYEDHAFTGYASVDLQLFREDTASSSHHQVDRLWAIALHPYLTDSAATFATFHALHRGSLHPQTGQYHLTLPSTVPPGNGGDLVLQEAQLLSSLVGSLDRIGAPRSYVVVDYIFHPNVSTMSYRSFFHTCRLHGVCFDVERCVGSVFLLADSLTAGVFGVVSSGDTATQAMQYLRTAFEVIAREVGTQSLSFGGDPGDAASSQSTSGGGGNFAEVLSLVRHRLGVEKCKDKKKESNHGTAAAPSPQMRQAEAAVGDPSSPGTPTMAGSGHSQSFQKSPPKPTLRVGKMDQLKRMRRTPP